ncbi:hypothetical protein CC80DRAFT_488561 [Byssothecium circinans]|uniref:Uncharacterized protein n=1 Tax=Byssothecium circinans TaxID=147558 RepID=A0A6A5UJI6_9PLEO|nr:hypothetical protein CC80DRAFT_488561 [Byssothecium circinans]
MPDPNTTITSNITTTIPPTTMPSPTAQDPPTLTLIFGVLGTLLAIIGLAIAALQLRHMHHRHRAARNEGLEAVKMLTRVVSLQPIDIYGASVDGGPRPPEYCKVKPARTCSMPIEGYKIKG